MPLPQTAFMDLPTSLSTVSSSLSNRKSAKATTLNPDVADFVLCSTMSSTGGKRAGEPYSVAKHWQYKEQEQEVNGIQDEQAKVLYS